MKHKLYECGFSSIHDVNVQTNFNFILLAVFLVLYDIEFMFFIPLLFNLYYCSWFIYLISVLFFIAFFGSLIYDWEKFALSWQI